VRTYLTELCTLLARITEPSVAAVVLKHVHQMIPYFQVVINPLFDPGLWIRIGSGFNDFVDPDSESGSMGKKNEEKNALFLNCLNIFIATR
jgi:hypothetical protein